MSESALQTSETTAPTSKGDTLAGISEILGGGAGDGEGQKPDAEPGESSKAGEGGQKQPLELSSDELLADEPKGAEGGDAGRDATKAPTTLAELAEIAGLELEDIYKLQVGFGGDEREPVTLGALKDQVADTERVSIESDLLDARESEFENEMIRAKAEIAEVLKLIPNVTPELVAKAKQEHLYNIEKERRALAEIMPSWSDERVYAKAQGDMLSLVSVYGITRNDLDSVNDHRVTKLIYDASQMKIRIDRANAAMKEQRDVGQKRRGQGASKKQTTDQIKPGGSKQDTLAGISQILSESKA